MRNPFPIIIVVVVVAIVSLCIQNVLLNVWLKCLGVQVSSVKTHHCRKTQVLLTISVILLFAALLVLLQHFGGLLQ